MGGVAAFAIWSFCAWYAIDMIKYAIRERNVSKNIERLKEHENTIKRVDIKYFNRSIESMASDSENKSFGQHN